MKSTADKQYHIVASMAYAYHDKFVEGFDTYEEAERKRKEYSENGDPYEVLSVFNSWDRVNMASPITIDVTNIPPKITTEVVFVVNKSKEYVRELMLQPQKSDITYYAPIHTAHVNDVPDYSDTDDWMIETWNYTVDLIQPYWHHDAEEIIEWIKGTWFVGQDDIKFTVLK
jgi:hypothetical protein